MSTLFSSSKILYSSSSFQSSHAPSPPAHHSFSESMMEENIENAESIITKWDPNSSSYTKVASLFLHNRKEAKEFLQSVKFLRQAMHFLVSQRSTSNKLVLAQNLMQIAMRRLENEFYQILSTNHEQLDPDSVLGQSSGSSDSFDEDNEAGSDEELKIASELVRKVERVSALAMSDLKSIADCMISSGYGKECVQVYKLSRRSIVDEGMYQLGIERFRSSHIHKMNSEALEHVINNWLKAVTIAVKTLFHGEKILCDHVFSASQTIRESCFFETTKDVATNLFRFPELVTKGKKSPERIFQLLELYEAICNLWPEIEMTFDTESTSAIKLQALSSLLRLGESVRSNLSDFESTIQKDSSKTPTPGGGIHPLTRTVMSYIASLADYGGVLFDIVAHNPARENTPLPESYFESSTSDDGSTPAVTVHLAWLILVLLCKLDNKAELYKNVSLSYLFLANNLHFIVKQVQATRLKDILGDNWVFKHAKKVRQYAASYESMAWNKVFSSFPDKTSPEMSPEAVKECFKRFNVAFEDAYRKQTSWIVPDRKLRDELKVSIVKKLVPAYREFYDRYLVILSGEKDLRALVWFEPNDLGNYLSDLFHGTTTSGSSSSSSSSHSRGCMSQ